MPPPPPLPLLLRQYHARSSLLIVFALTVFSSNLPYGDSTMVRFIEKDIVIDCSISHIDYLYISKSEPVMEMIASFHRLRTA